MTFRDPAGPTGQVSQQPVESQAEPLPEAEENTERQALPGLQATYRDAQGQLTLITPSPNLYLRPGESVHPSFSDNFEAEWQGQISILWPGNYRFECEADVFIDGNRTNGTEIELAAGIYPIRITYQRRAGPARIQLRWSSEEFREEPIPTRIFSHIPDPESTEQGIRIERGRDLIENLGCINCHDSGSSRFLARRGPDLSQIGSRVKAGWLHRWLQDPRGFRKGAVMPITPMKDQERWDVVAYLSQLKGSETGHKAVAVTDEMIAKGQSLYQTIGCAQCHDQEELNLGAMGSKMEHSQLSEYLLDPLAVEPGGHMPSMQLTKGEADHLAAWLIQNRNPDFESDGAQGDIQRGRKYVQSMGCLACHRLVDDQALPNQLVSPPLEKLESTGGCLDTRPSGPDRQSPSYALEDRDRQDILEFLAWNRQRPDIRPAPIYQFRRTLQRYRCSSCHEMDHEKPAEGLTEIPPMLTDVGVKLRRSALGKVINEKQRARPWLRLRMPHYGPVLDDAFVDGFSQAWGLEPGEGELPDHLTKQHQEQGLVMLGNDFKNGGLTCIGCHDFRDFKALGAQSAPNLVGMVERLRFGWYQRWMQDAMRIRPGTAMPTFFAGNPKADELILNLWAVLSMGDAIPVPKGAGKLSVVLGSEEAPVPGKEALVIRCFLPNATPASIAVGMPGGLSYCFDAGTSRLAYAWRGGFLDLSPNLKKEALLARLLGEIFFTTPEDFGFRLESSGESIDRRFRGYRIVDGFPEFLVRAGNIDVRQRFTLPENKYALQIEYELTGVDQPLLFNLPEQETVNLSTSIAASSDGRFRIPKAAQFHFTVTVEPVDESEPEEVE